MAKLLTRAHSSFLAIAIIGWIFISDVINDSGNHVIVQVLQVMDSASMQITILVMTHKTLVVQEEPIRALD